MVSDWVADVDMKPHHLSVLVWLQALANRYRTTDNLTLILALGAKDGGTQLLAHLDYPDKDAEIPSKITIEAHPLGEHKGRYVCEINTDDPECAWFKVIEGRITAAMALTIHAYWHESANGVPAGLGHGQLRRGGIFAPAHLTGRRD